MKDGSLGVVFEAELLEHEPLTSRQITDAVEGLSPFFELPENCTLQFLYDQSSLSSFDEKIKKMEQGFSEAHPVSRLLFDEKAKALKEFCQKSSEARPLKRRMYISIRYFLQSFKRGKIKDRLKQEIKDSLKRGEVTLCREMKDFVRELKTFKHILQSIETASPLPLRRLKAEELLDFLRQFFNPKTYYKRDFVPYNKNLSLSEQFLYNFPILDYPSIEREGVKTRTLTLKTSPSYAYPGGMAYFVGLDFPFKLSLNFAFPSKSKVNRFFDFKEFFLENTPTAKGKVQREEIKEVQDRLARKDRCLQLTFNIILEGESEEELDAKTQKSNSYLPPPVRGRSDYRRRYRAWPYSQ